MSDTYTRKMVLNTIKEGRLIREDVYQLDVDHPVRIALYDVEMAAKRIKNKQLRRVFDQLLRQDTINEIANDMHTYERDIYRKIDKLTTLLIDILEGKR